MNYYCCLARSLRCGSKIPLENVQIGRIFQDLFLNTEGKITEFLDYSLRWNGCRFPQVLVVYAADKYFKCCPLYYKQLSNRNGSS